MEVKEVSTDTGRVNLPTAVQFLSLAQYGPIEDDRMDNVHIHTLIPRRQVTTRTHQNFQTRTADFRACTATSWTHMQVQHRCAKFDINTFLARSKL